MTAETAAPAALLVLANKPLEEPVVELLVANTPESPGTELDDDSPFPVVEEKLLLPVKELVPARTGTLVVSKFKVVVPPRATTPPPVRSVPAVTVREEFCSMAFVMPALGTGKVCPVANVIWPLLAMFSPVSAKDEVPSANSRFSVPEGEDVSLPAGSACQRKV